MTTEIDNDGVEERNRKRAELAALLGLLRRDSTPFELLLLSMRVGRDSEIHRWRTEHCEDDEYTPVLEVVKAFTPEQRRALADRLR